MRKLAHIHSCGSLASSKSNGEGSSLEKERAELESKGGQLENWEGDAADESQAAAGEFPLAEVPVWEDSLLLISWMGPFGLLIER